MPSARAFEGLAFSRENAWPQLVTSGHQWGNWGKEKTKANQLVLLDDDLQLCYPLVLFGHRRLQHILRLTWHVTKHASCPVMISPDIANRTGALGMVGAHISKLTDAKL